MLKLKHLAILLVLLMPLDVWSAAAIAVSVAPPASSSGAVAGKSIVKSMIFSPCVKAATTFGQLLDTDGKTVLAKGTAVNNFFDQFTIKITGSNDDAKKDGVFDYDLYFFFVNTSGTGTASPTTISDAQFYVIRRYLAASPTTGAPQKLYGVDVTLRANVTGSAPDMLLRGVDFSSSAINEVIFGGDIDFGGYNLPQGTWLAVAILAVPPLDLNDPTSWIAWDAFPFMLGSPWATNPAKTCE